jgi:putative ABC transport system permease protein
VLQSYFKIAYRNLLRHRAYSLINISGLAIGIASVILISLFVTNEFKYDRNHEHIDRIYRLIREDEQGATSAISVHASGGEGEALSQDFTGVESVCRFQMEPTWIEAGMQGFIRKVAFVDPNALDVLTIPFLAGDPKTALSQNQSAIITEEVAQLLFGDEDALGKTFAIETLDVGQAYQVTGIVAPQTTATTLPFDVMTATLYGNKAAAWDRWDFNKIYAGGPETIVLLEADADSKAIQASLNKLTAERNPMESTIRYYLRPLADTQLYLRQEFGILGSTRTSYGSIEEIFAYSAIAVVILLIACVNFMNLTTARATNRIREVGLRKVAGAIRSQVVYQFLGEAVLLSFIAFAIAIVIVDLGMGSFSNLIGRKLSWLFLLESQTLTTGLLLLALITGVAAGSYPAFYLSRFSPTDIMGSGTSGRPRGSGLRKLLVVTQFGLSIVFLVSTLTVKAQLDYMHTKDLGFDRERIIQVPIFRRDWEVNKGRRGKNLRIRYRMVKERALQIPNVLAATSTRFGQGVYATPMAFEANGQEYQFSMFDVDEDYLDFFDLELINGRNLRASDVREMETIVPPPGVDLRTADRRTLDFSQMKMETVVFAGAPRFLLNESAAKVLGWGEDVEHQPLRMKTHRSQGRQGFAVGILKNFHIESLHTPIRPAAFRFFNGGFKHLYLKIGPGDIPSTIAEVETLWKDLLPERPFEFQFLDDQVLASRYEDELRLSQTFSALSALAIVVACMGLFGLASYVAEQRNKEIGVRKVLGASRTDILTLISGSFIAQILIANVLAWPVAFYMMQEWLQGFAYRVSLDIWPFLIAAAMTTVLTAITISGRAFAASNTDPIKAIRVE